MNLPPQAVHLPFSAGPYRMAMGLVALPPDELIELDERYPAEMAERRQLLGERHAQVFAAVPGSEPARRAVLDRIADVLPRRHPTLFTRDGATLHNHITGEAWNLADPPLDPLEVAGRLVQEDLCLLAPGPDGPILAAAVLCFPSGWSLAEKIGRPLAEIHAPVPLYGETLAKPVDRFTRALKPGKLTSRLNWSLSDTPALFRPKGHGRRDFNSRVTPENAGEMLYLKVERQTLSVIDDAGGVLFGIRVHCYPLARIAARPELAAELASAVRGLPESLTLYKSFLPFRAALLGWLDARAG